MPRNLTSAQKERKKRRLRSIRQQQASGAVEIDTSRFDRWGLPRGASPPSEDAPSNQIKVRVRWISDIVEYWVDTPTKAWGYTENNFPMFCVYQVEDGVWTITPHLFSMPATGARQVLFRTPERTATNTRSFPGYFRGFRPRLALFDAKKDALGYVGAGGSRGDSDHRGKYYTVPASELSERFDKTFGITSDQKSSIWDSHRGGVFRNVHKDIRTDEIVIPSYDR